MDVIESKWITKESALIIQYHTEFLKRLNRPIKPCPQPSVEDLDEFFRDGTRYVIES